MIMTQEQRDANRAKRMAELEDLIPNTLRCVEVLKQHAPTLKYVRQWQLHCIDVYRMDLPAVKEVLANIAADEMVCPVHLWAIYQADYLCPIDGGHWMSRSPSKSVTF